MTDQLDSRTTRTVTAFMDETEHPLRRSTFTPVEGVAVVPEVDEVEREVPVADEAPAIPADPGYPRPPERGSLDDEDLVPLVGRHTDDTATVDLIGILQAQMHLRATEAARFAEWEQQIRRIGTEEALDELERTRLHFTGVIPIQTSPSALVPAASPAPLITADQAPFGTTLVPERILPAEPQADAAVIPAGTAPRTAPSPDAPTNPHLLRAREADDELLDRADDTSPVRPVAAVSTSRETAAVAGVSILAVLVVVAALILSPLGAAPGGVAAVAAAGVVAAAWLGLIAARLSLRGLDRTPGPLSTRSRWAVAAALVLGTAVGEGIVRTSAEGVGWQGYLLSLVQVHGLHAEASIAAGLVAALIVAFVVAVLVVRRPGPVSSSTTIEQDRLAD